MTYYTFITVNRKAIKIEESKAEHDARIKRIRAAETAKRKEEERKAKGIVKDVYIVCPKCNNKYPYSTLPKYRECPKCSILSMYN